MVMGGVLLEYMAKRPLAEENHPIQTFGFNRQDKSLSVRVQIRRSRWYLHRLDIHRSEWRIEVIAELTIPIVHQILAVVFYEHAFFDIGDIPCDLYHPFLMRIHSDSRDVNLARAQMDEEEDVLGDQAEAGPHLRGEEIGSYQYIHMASDELTPGRFLLPLGNRW